MSFRPLLVAILYFVSMPTLAQTAYPECAFQSTDPDGDGFGYENNATCVVTNNSQVADELNDLCIDHNGDGWGWNGISSCQVPVVQTTCTDTDPIGDGWGWNGTESCRLGSLESALSNEIEMVKRHFDRDRRASVITCPPIGISGLAFDVNIVITLYYEGLMKMTADGTQLFGNWSSGLSHADGIIHLFIVSDVYTGIYTRNDLFVSDDSVQFNSTECNWTT